MTSLTLTCQAVLFDLDGVLVDSRAVVERTWQRWAQRHGFAAAEIIAKAHGRRTIETVREVAPHLQAAGEVRWLESAELNDVQDLVALPGAARVFASVPDDRRAVVTSGGRALATLRLRAAGLDVPTELVAAEDVDKGKPAPDGYLRAVARLGFGAGECLVVEDAPPGIAAGKSAGAVVVAVATTFKPAELAGADVLIRSLDVIRISMDERGLRVEIAS